MKEVQRAQGLPHELFAPSRALPDARHRFTQYGKRIDAAACQLNFTVILIDEIVFIFRQRPP